MLLVAGASRQRQVYNLVFDRECRGLHDDAKCFVIRVELGSSRR